MAEACNRQQARHPHPPRRSTAKGLSRTFAAAQNARLLRRLNEPGKTGRPARFVCLKEPTMETRKPCDRNALVQRIEHERVSAIIRTKDQSLAADAMSAAVEGGFRMVEFTLTTPGANELIASFSKRNELLVGAGTVMSIAQAREAVAAGARFLVSPIADVDVIAEAASLGVPIIPGAFTPTEMEHAHRLGADFIKVFPAPAGGVGFIEAVLGPLPHLKLFPTAGVTPDNFTTYLDAGCAGMGFVRSLFVPSELAARSLDAVRDRAKKIIARLSAWRDK